MSVLSFIYIFRRAVLNDFSGVHDCHLVAYLSHNSQVMGNQDDGRVDFLLQLLHHIQNLRLNGHIQGRGRLIGQQKLRLAGQGHCYDHTLLHTPGKLMGVILFTALRNPHQLKHFLNPLLLFLRRQIHVKLQGLTNLVPHCKDRIQAGHGVLKNHGYLFSPDLPHVLLGCFYQILPVKHDFSAGNPPRYLWQKAHEGKGKGGLTGAGLSHQTNGLPLVQGEGYVIDCLDNVLVRRILHAQILNFQQLLFHIPAPFRFYLLKAFISVIVFISVIICIPDMI